VPSPGTDEASRFKVSVHVRLIAASRPTSKVVSLSIHFRIKKVIISWKACKTEIRTAEDR